jgi:hypothetical protein
LRIEGEGKHRARIAYATIVDGRLQYEFDEATEDAKDLQNNSNDAVEDMAV